MILTLSLGILFLLLAAIHFNWALGGTFGFERSLPTNEKGDRVLNPKKVDSAIVGMALLVFGLFYTIQSGVLAVNMPTWAFRYGGWIIPTTFLLRAMGDFKYVGFFKKIRKTPFAKLDTRLFSPLCLLIGAMGILVQLRVG
ncbi:MAG: DUF3995 domain-containing protein [Flavobacteriaceae bacterium]